MLKSVMAYDFADERVVKSVDKLDSVQKMNVQLSLLMKLSYRWLVFVGPKFSHALLLAHIPRKLALFLRLPIRLVAYA